MKKGQKFDYKGNTYEILSVYAQQVATQHETEIDGGHFTIWDRKHMGPEDEEQRVLDTF